MRPDVGRACLQERGEAVFPLKQERQAGGLQLNDTPEEAEA